MRWALVRLSPRPLPPLDIPNVGLGNQSRVVQPSGESVDAAGCFSDCLVQRLPTRYQLVDPGIRLNGPTAMSSGPTR